jgi:hypothetical protein
MAKCLFLGTMSSLRKKFLVEESVGGRCNLKKLKINHSGTTWKVPVVEVAPVPRRSVRLRSVRNILLLDNDEPLTYSEVMVGPDSESSLGAMKSELKSVDENQVWNLVDPPDGVKAVKCK